MGLRSVFRVGTTRAPQEENRGSRFAQVGRAIAGFLGFEVETEAPRALSPILQKNGFASMEDATKFLTTLMKSCPGLILFILERYVSNNEAQDPEATRLSVDIPDHVVRAAIENIGDLRYSNRELMELLKQVIAVSQSDEIKSAANRVLTASKIPLP